MGNLVDAATRAINYDVTTGRVLVVLGGLGERDHVTIERKLLILSLVNICEFHLHKLSANLDSWSWGVSCS